MWTLRLFKYCRDLGDGGGSVISSIIFIMIVFLQCNMKQQLRILKALSDETRLKIVEFLLNGEKCVCEIFPHVKRTQSTTSIQLDVLRKAGILDSRKDGKKVYYFISDKKVCDIFRALGYSDAKLMKKERC